MPRRACQAERAAPRWRVRVAITTVHTVAAAAKESIQAASLEGAPVHAAASGPKSTADLEENPGVTIS